MHQFQPREYNTNLVGNNCSLIHTYQVAYDGVEGITLNFENINLPVGTLVEFSDAKYEFVKIATFDQQDAYSITVDGDEVNIKITLSQYPTDSDNFSLFLKEVAFPFEAVEPFGIIGEDQRLPYMCYAGTEIGDHSLAAAKMRFVSSGTGSSLGSGNKFMTNFHVLHTGENLKNGEVWFNWMNESCDPHSPVKEPVRVDTDNLLAIGEGGARDYAIFTIKEFDLKNAQIKTLFGGLKIRESKPDLEEAIYVPQYGNGSIRPMYISSANKEGPARITTSNNDWVKYNADTQGGSSGSPVIAVKDNEIVCLHSTAFGKENGGTSPVLLFNEIGDLLKENNESIIGEGKVTAFNTGINLFETASIEVDFGKKGKIVPFDTVRLKHFSTYSIAEIESMNIASGIITPTELKLEAISEHGSTHIGDNRLSGKVTINISNVDRELPGGMTSFRHWLALKMLEDGETTGNYLTRLTHASYDPFTPPFEPGDAIEMNLELVKNGNTIAQRVEGAQYGYIALYAGEGPQSLIVTADGYSTLRTMVKDNNGKINILTLRGKRATGCSRRPMNVNAGCADNVQASTLIIEFHPEDNPDLDLNHSFSGIIPIQATRGGDNTKNILLNISLKDDNGGNTNYPAWSPNRVQYIVGDYVTHKGGIYICTQAHMSNSGWAPGVANTLWKLVGQAF